MNSKIILVKGIQIDKEYKNVLNYTENQMLTLCRSQEHLIAEASDYSFLRHTGTIMAGFTYSQCLQANYIAFQNPDYSNKWFFAWVDDVVYKGDKNTEIKFTIDAWSTWFDYWTQKNCLVLREHVNDDIVGKYTQPEPVDTGEYVIDNIENATELNSLAIVMLVTEYMNQQSSHKRYTNLGGVAVAGSCYTFTDWTILDQVVRDFVANQKEDAIISVYLVPRAIIDRNDWGSIPFNAQFDGQNAPVNISHNITKPTTLNGYTPKNKKMLTFPYCYLNVSNNSGSTNSMCYEMFNEVDEYPNQCIFNIKGVPVIGGSIKICPINYKNNQEINIENEGLLAGKYPTLSWSKDEFISWLTQNNVNLGIGLASSGMTLIASALMLSNPATALGGAGGIVSSSMSIASQINDIYLHSLAPNTSKGNTNGGDINVCSNSNTFIFEKMSIKEETARVIDDYFTRFGYKINKIKIPNITGRTYWNYVEIGETEEIGFGTVPSKYMNIINNACRKGVTIWHNHANVGNYALNNTIVS